MYQITEKQINFIKVICEELGIEFVGTTKKDATEFISKNICELNKQQAINQIYFEEYWKYKISNKI